jgi:uncharacterized protein
VERFAAVECGSPKDEGTDDVESEMSQPAKAQEPSMEEILASIRRIISDDEAKPAAASAAAPAPAPAAPSKPAALKPAHAAPAKVAEPQVAPKAPVAPPVEKNSQDDIDAMLASFDAPAAPSDDADDDVFELTEQMAVQAPSNFQTVVPQNDLEFSEPPAPVPPVEQRVAPSMKPEAAMQSVLSGSTATAVESAFNSLANTVLNNNSRTLEDLVKEMLRPMLKTWLDDNLPTMVERIVRAEIERVARGR